MASVGRSDARASAIRSQLRSTLGALASPETWERQLREVIALVESSLQRGPRLPPEPCTPPAGQPLGYTLAHAAIASPDAAEGYARGALRAGHSMESILAWAAPRSDHPREGDAAVAAAAGMLRERGYAPLVAWAAANDDAPAVRAVEPPPGIHRELFAVPRRAYLLGRAIQRKFEHDYPYTAPALHPPVPLGGDPAAFRPELIPALSQEREFQAFMSQMSSQEYEDVILPLSRVPGLNALVLAALLLDEILDPMEVLNWIGQEIHQLPRTGTPDRPEDILQLAPPQPAVPGAAAIKYMVFSDTHREAQQDVDFRIDHFSNNEAIYLRALDYCDANGYIVIENGDCEELWYEPTFDPALRQTKLDRFTNILQRHPAVYQKLRALDAQGRYFRSIGNHDSYLWEDPALVAWRGLAINNFPTIHSGFIIPQCKPMDDGWPHIGLNAGDYAMRTDLFMIHGHNFDFWNCDEHNRLGKFITNLLGVPFDAFDNIAFDYRGVDWKGHPLIQFWDFLDAYAPWSNWPAHDVARSWAQLIAYKPLVNNLTQDSIIFSETFAAIWSYVMYSGGIDFFNFGLLLCIGHTHNPQSRPWIPYLSGYNPLRTYEVLGERVFENLFAIKTRYLNSGTVGWWQDVIWALEITENGQPRLVYWCNEDSTPVTMDWELDDEPATPGNPLPALETWWNQYVVDELERRLDASTAASSTAGGPMPLMAPGGGGHIATIAGWGTPQQPRRPDIASVERLLAATTTGVGLPAPGLISGSTLGVASSLVRSALQGNREMLAALTLAARQNPLLGGSDPRTAPATLAQGVDLVPSSSTLGRLLWPQLVQGTEPSKTSSPADIVSMLRALFWSYSPPNRSAATGASARPSTSSAR